MEEEFGGCRTAASEEPSVGSRSKALQNNQEEDDSSYGSDDFDEQSRAETQEPYVSGSDVSFPLIRHGACTFTLGSVARSTRQA